MATRNKGKRTQTRTHTATTTVTAADFVEPKPHIAAAFSSLQRWPKALGAQPSKAAVKLAETFNRSGGAVTMAWAMYARPQGASDVEAAMAANAATGSKSASHRVKRDIAAANGHITVEQLASRNGRTVYRIALPVKQAVKAKAQPVETQPASDAATGK